jgi:folate-binding protein YgfZ
MPFQIPASPFHVVLGNRRIIDIEGPDAQAFLQAQLTTDVAHLSPGQWRLAGYCSPKGRLLASGLLFATASGYAWLVADDLAAALVKRLRMFVLRLKVSVEIRAAAVIGRVGGEVLAAHAVVSNDDATVSTWLALPEVDGHTRAFGLVADAHTDAFLASHPSDEDHIGQWTWLEVRSGLSFIETATQDRFVPQMVNLEALGGVDFKKGCYPGQEVVARSQYLGKLKRRTLLAHSKSSAELALPAVGGDVFGAGNEPVGTVVSAARAPDDSIDCLIEAPLTAWEQGLKLKAQSEAMLEPLQMPYPLPDNEVFVRPKL